jgi:hypothetical protein
MSLAAAKRVPNKDQTRFHFAVKMYITASDLLLQSLEAGIPSWNLFFYFHESLGLRADLVVFDAE